MAGVPVPVYQQHKRSSLKTECKAIISTQQLFKVLRDIQALASYTPLSVEESEEWAYHNQLG
jgi:hypothetical protein